jgi:hypothetical protein
MKKIVQHGGMNHFRGKKSSRISDPLERDRICSPVAFTDDMKYFAVSVNDSTVHFKETSSNKLVSIINIDRESEEEFSILKFLRDSYAFLYTDSESRVFKIDPFNSEIIYTYGEDGLFEYDKIHEFPERNIIVLVSEMGYIEVIDSRDGSFINKIDPNFSYELNYRITKNGQEILLWEKNDMIYIYDLIENKPQFLATGLAELDDCFYDESNKTYVAVNKSLSVKVFDAASFEEKISISNQPGMDIFSFTTDYYYTATKSSAKNFNFTDGELIYPFEQFDLKFNRPDIVLQSIGSDDTKLIQSYYQAYQKRLKKLGFNEEDLSGELHVPKSTIHEYEYLPVIDEDELNLRFSFADTKYNLDRYNIWINDVPVYGVKDKSLKHLKTRSFSVTESLKLLKGNNKIQVSCHNIKGAESYKETLEITCNPKNSAKPDLYFVALSVSEYYDQSMNLRYAVKDGRDLSNLLTKNEEFNNIYIDTLFNQNATKENILNMKERLLNTKVEDQAILFVSGHGLLDDSFDFYFATHDIDFNNPAGRGISYDELEWLLDSIPARKKLFLMDACHSGEVDKEEIMAVNDEKFKEGRKSGVKKYTYRAGTLQYEDVSTHIGLQNSFELMRELFTTLNRGSGAVVISAAAGDSYAMESDEWQNGVFTYSILQGLQSGDADANDNGEITVSELRDYVSKSVQDLTNGLQKPTMRQENVEFDWRVW